MMTNDKYTRLVKLQKAFFNEHITREIPFRLCALDRLAEALVSREKQLGEALHADLGKSAFESYATEIGFLLHEIRTTKNHLQSWARDRHRPTPLFLFGSLSVLLLLVHALPSILLSAFWVLPLNDMDLFSAVDIACAAYILVRMASLRPAGAEGAQ